MAKQLTKTTDLSGGNYWNDYSDGSATLRNCDKGLRFDISASEVTRLRELVLSGEADKIRVGA